MAEKQYQVRFYEANQHNLSSADTPPASPHVDDDSQINQIKQRRTIHIDDNGVHDFDFKKRLEEGGPKKLKKFSRRTPAIHQRSSSLASSMSVADAQFLPQRTPSDSSDNTSIRKRFSSLLTGSTSLHKTNSGKSQNSARTSLQFEEDPLPDTKQGLEIRLNYHLSELDMLKRTLRAANDVIRQHQERFQILQTRATPEMQVAMGRQESMVELARTNRDSYVTFVSFHRRQLERIKHKRIEIEIDAGLEPSLPEVYKQMWTDDDWSRLFSV